MANITSQHVHDRQWVKCPHCLGWPLTQKQKKDGFLCGSCDNKGEVARHPNRKPNLWFGYSSRGESRS